MIIVKSKNLENCSKEALLTIVQELSAKNSAYEQAIVDITVNNAIYRQRTRKNNVLFSDFIRQWLESNRNNWQSTTYEGYRSNINKHIAPYFEHMEITLFEMCAFDIQEYYNMKRAEGLTTNSLSKHHNNIRRCLNYALKLNLIERNPAEQVDKPKSITFEANFYTPEEIQQLLATVKKSAIMIPVVLAAFLGLRRSEVLGLKWDAVDFAMGTITIKRKMIRITEQGKDVLKLETRMKNKSSHRTLSLPSQLLQYLQFIKNCQQSYLKNADDYSEKYIEFICVNPKGNIISPTNLSNTFARVVKKNNLKYLRFHDLRHSCASILYKLGYDLKDIQEWLGHSSISTTANLYIHLDFKNKVAIANGLNDLFQLKATSY